MEFTHSRQRLLGSVRRWQWMLAVVLAAGFALFVAVRIFAGPTPTVTTDKPEYGTFELVTITGTGYTPGQLLDIQVVRPDLTIVTGDGTNTPGYDSVSANGSGSFIYYYQLNDYPAGTFTVLVLDNATSNVLATTTFEDGKILSATLKYLDFGFGSPVDITLVETTAKAHFAPGPDSNHGPIIGVAAGGTLTVDRDGSPPFSVGPRITLDIDNGTSVVRIQIHTSCSTPIGEGFLYGDDDEDSEDLSEFPVPFTAGIEITALTSQDCRSLQELTTEVHDPDHTDITNGKVDVGTAVHDEATLTDTVAFEAGVITFTLYPSGDCTGSPVNTPENVAFSAGAGPITVESSGKAALGAGGYSYQASYAGDSNHGYQRGACEPFIVSQTTTSTPTPTATATASSTATATASPTATATASPTATATASPTATATASPTATATASPTATPTATNTPGPPPPTPIGGVGTFLDAPGASLNVGNSDDGHASLWVTAAGAALVAFIFGAVLWYTTRRWLG